jgi:hypothetical protein
MRTILSLAIGQGELGTPGGSPARIWFDPSPDLFDVDGNETAKAERKADTVGNGGPCKTLNRIGM